MVAVITTIVKTSVVAFTSTELARHRETGFDQFQIPKQNARQSLVPRFFVLYIPAMSNPYDEDGKMAEANKLLDEAKTFLYIGKVREARKVWDQEPIKDDREYHETFWKKIYEDCYQEGYLKTSWWKRALAKLTGK